jgi:hypothetical protein
MATQNSPQGHEKTADRTMAFNGIDGILGTGGGKTASRREQGRNQDLICPDQDKKKVRGALLQKIYHYTPSS